jgi:histidinol phosphatase-like PHP family hydrolase
MIPGIEITHVPPSLIGDMAEKARRLGARLVAVHGESIVEPFIPGTNKAGILASIDVLSHPGLITEEEVRLAKEKNVLLEISARKGHCLGNGHVARLAKKIGAKLVISTDAHAPSDLIDETMARKVALGAGLTEEDYLTAQKNAEAFL